MELCHLNLVPNFTAYQCINQEVGSPTHFSLESIIYCRKDSHSLQFVLSKDQIGTPYLTHLSN